MAAPRGKPGYQTPAERPIRERDSAKRLSERTFRRSLQIERSFLVLVVPVFLMLGSVYTHTVASGLEREVVRLEEEKARAESEGERLEVRITELSEPGRIRALARENIGMRDPGKDLETYGSDGEDAVHGGEETYDKRFGE